MLRCSVALVVLLSVVGLATPIHKARPRVAPPSPVRSFSETDGVVGLTEADDAARPSPPPVEPAPDSDLSRVAKRAKLERRFDPFSFDDINEELESNDGPVSTQELHLGETHNADTSAEEDFEALFTPRGPPSAASQYDVFPAHDPQPRSPEPEFSYSKFQKNLRDGRPITGYVGVLHNPIGHFSFYPAPGSRDLDPTEFECVKHKTSETALADGCLFATNAGFFVVETGACLGNVVFNGTVHQIQTFDSQPAWEKRANFGIDSKGNFVTGYLTTDQVQNLNGGFQELLTGRGWLIRNGSSYLDSSISIEGIDHRFVTIKAPRTGIGYDKAGRLVILSVDGEEDIAAGADMYEFTELFLDLGVLNAVNLDGGGSGTVFYQGQVVSKPTCDDTPVICERPVTTITCVK